MTDYRAAFRASPTACLLLSPALEILDASEAYLVAAGTTREAIVGRALREVAPADPRAAATGGGLDARWPSPIQTPVLGPDGATTAIIHHVEDVGALERAVADDRLQRAERRIAELQEADRLKDEFFDTVSHELRTPIHVLMGFVDLLGRGTAGDLNDRQRGFLDRMREVTGRLGQLVEEILTMGQLRAGTLPMAFAPVEVPPIVAATLAHLAPAADAKGQALHDEAPADLPQVLADEARVAQVLANLVHNAVKFTPAGGAIRVVGRHDGGRVRLAVVDTGPGIAEADQGRLFNRFTQLEAGAARSTDGVGLGLAIAREIIEAHGGAIGVESAPGRGSAFWFELPVAAGRQEDGNGQDLRRERS